jgi:hypothetical protein
MKHLPIALCLGLIFQLAASALPIEVDPATSLTGTYAVEWNTAANFQSWTTTQVTGATVSGGTLSNPPPAPARLPSGRAGVKSKFLAVEAVPTAGREASRIPLRRAWACPGN